MRYAPSRVRKPEAPESATVKQPLCKLEDIPEAGTRIVPFFGRDVHVYRAGPDIRAAVNVCLHFGGPLEFKGQRLVCA